MKFFDSLKANDIRNLYILHGQEEYVKEQALASLEDIVLKGAMRDMNISFIDGETANTDDIIASAQTLPLFNPKRLVIVKNYSPLYGKALNDKERKILIDYLAKVPDYLCLVFFCRGNIHKNTALFRAISKYGIEVTFDPLKDKELILWIRTAFKRAGKIISPQDAEYMALMAGNDLASLVHEIDKIVNYTGNAKSVSAHDIDAVVTRVSAANIFKLVDAIGDRDADKALYYISELIQAGESPVGMLSMIARQFRILLQCQILMDNGYSVKEIASEIHLPFFVVNGCKSQLKNFTRQQLVSALRLCLVTDVRMKSTSFKQDMLIEELVFALKNNGL